MFIPVKFTIRNYSEKIKILHDKQLKKCYYINDFELDNYYIVPIQNLNVDSNMYLHVFTQEEFNILLEKLPEKEIKAYKQYLFEYAGSDILVELEQ